jgi:TolA-binding protein
MSLSSKSLRPFLPLAGGAALAVLLLGCAPAGDTQQMQADQSTLRGIVANNQQQLDALQEKIQRLDDRISELEHNGPVSAGDNKITSLDQRVTKLESQVSSSPAGAGAAPTPGASGPEAPNGTSEGGGTTATGPPGAGESSTTAATGPSLPEVANAPSWRTMMDQELATSHNDPAAKIYRAGLVDLQANKYSQALGQFQTLQRRYPKSNLSEPAEFFAANALYEMGNYDQSILQFNDQTMRFPKGHFASAALLREAQAFMKINDRIDARLTLQKLLSDLPDSPEAPMAKSMMQTLAS